MNGADLNARSAAFAALTTEQIRSCFAAAGMTKSVARSANVYNLIRAGQLNEVIGTLKAGAAAATQKKGRQALRKALRAYVPGL